MTPTAPLRRTSEKPGDLTSEELRRIRLFGSLAALLLIALPFIRNLAGARPVDPVWERAVVLGVTIAAAWANAFYRGPLYRYVTWGVYYLITLWIVQLLVLNRFSTDYALGIFLVVAAISALFTDVRALGWYLAVAIAAMIVGALAAPPGGGVGNRALYVFEFAIVCVLLFATVGGRLSSEEKARRTELRYRALIESTDDVIAVVDPSGRITYASPASSRVFGHAPEKLRGRSIVEVVEAADRGRFRTMLEDAAGHPGRTVAGARLRLTRDGGSTRYVEPEIRDLRNHPGVEGLLVVTRDVTEQVELEEELRTSQKMEAVGRLAGGVAHDFNNLLAIVSSRAELVLESLPEGAEAREDVWRIQDAGRRAAEVTRQLLAVGKRQEMSPVVFDLGERLLEMEPVLKSLAGDGVELYLAAHGASLPVQADPSQLERVVANLVANARDAMPDGGRVTVEARILPPEGGADPAVAGPSAQAGEGGGDGEGALPIGLRPVCVLSVSDTGVGIPSEVRGHIFDPFFTTKKDGTGLGLATVYGLVEQSGGTIEVESEPGRGTTFRVRLPVAVDDTTPHASGEAG